MRLINKETVTRVVDEYYPSSKYKIFTINSENGIDISKPTGLFISLGITTSLNTLESISNKISEKLDAKSIIAEIESRYISGVYSNKVSKRKDIEQYNSGAVNNGEILDKKGINELIDDLKYKLVENKDNKDKLMDYSCRLSKVSKILKRLELSPDNYSISVINTEKDFKLSMVNNKINYIQLIENYNGNDVIVHKRIGILVEF